MERDTRRWIFDLTVWTAGVLAMVLLGAEIAAGPGVQTPVASVASGGRSDAAAPHGRG
jgi:hypothetical protein